jgi:hypothetical protein
MKDLIGKRIRIDYMEGEPQYADKIGIVKSVDDMGQLHGTWGGLAVIPDRDSFSVIQ